MPCHLRNSKEPFVFPNVFPPFACIIMGIMGSIPKVVG
jgi:hypothetical protein